MAQRTGAQKRLRHKARDHKVFKKGLSRMTVLFSVHVNKAHGHRALKIAPSCDTLKRQFPNQLSQYA